MAISITYARKILRDIKRINQIVDTDRRGREFVASREKIQTEINDDLDEIYSHVNLGAAKASNVEVDNEINKIDCSYFFMSKDERDVADYHKMIDVTQKLFERLTLYEKEIVNTYIKVGSFRGVEEETKIPYSSVYNTIKNIEDKIRKQANRNQLYIIEGTRHKKPHNMNNKKQ